MTATAAWNGLAERLVRDLTGIFGARLRSVVVYGPHVEGTADTPLTSLVLVASLTASDLDTCAAQASQWRRVSISIPLLLPEEEFRQSLDAFPLEYSEIRRSHVKVFGDDPFEQVVIAREDLRRACETQVKSHLLHLREGYIEAGGHPTAIASLVRASAPAFATLLRNVASLLGVPTRDRAESTRHGALSAGLPAGLVNDILALEQPAAIPTADPARLFPEYLAAVERLALTVNTWRE